MNQSIPYYLNLFNSLNGFVNKVKTGGRIILYSFRVLFPGGEYSDQYFYVAKLFYIWSLKVKYKK
jgi:hypothetical protein